MGFPGSSAGKESSSNAGDLSLIPRLGRSPGEGIGYSLQYSWHKTFWQLFFFLFLIESDGEYKENKVWLKIRDTKGTFYAKMGSIKDRNGMDLTEADYIKKRWQEYIEELYKKDLHDPDNHDGEVTHLEPDILECEVKWALESISTNKASGGDGIPIELFQILKGDAVKVLHSICQKIWKTQ